MLLDKPDPAPGPREVPLEVLRSIPALRLRRLVVAHLGEGVVEHGAKVLERERRARLQEQLSRLRH